MAGSFQNEIPAARINLKLDVGKGNAKKKMELPLKMLVMGDFTQKKRTARVSDREKININKNNFEQVMKSQGLKLNYTVDNKLAGNADLKIDLDVNSMDSFKPENIAKAVPELSKLLAARNLLKDLKSNLLDNRAFRSRLEELMKNPSKAIILNKELNAIVNINQYQGSFITGSKTNEPIILQDIFETMSLFVPDKTYDISSFLTSTAFAESRANERICAALAVFVDGVLSKTESINVVDEKVLDDQISACDKQLSIQLDEILHNNLFQAMESAWRSLKFLIDRTDFRKNVKIDLLDVSKDELAEDFEDTPETIQSGLYKHIYIDEYDSIGGEPYAAMIANFEFDSSSPDMGFLLELSRVAASCHCPFIGSIGYSFFKIANLSELTKITDLHTFMEKPEFLRWSNYRPLEEARYTGLTLPRFLLRLPYGPDTVPVMEFNYTESIKSTCSNLWGNPSFAFATNLVSSFIEFGWCVQIRGPESGGKVEDLPTHLYDGGNGQQMKIPTEILIPETREYEFAQEGFIPLSFYKNGNVACFFSANSAQKPQETSDKKATANLRINSRLPYVFLISRIAHYLKVLQRETIGTGKSAKEIQDEFIKWLKSFISENSDSKPDSSFTLPFKSANVTVFEDEEKPEFFSVDLEVIPQFQVENFDIKLSAVMKLAKE